MCVELKKGFLLCLIFADEQALKAFIYGRARPLAGKENFHSAYMYVRMLSLDIRCKEECKIKGF